MISCYDLYNMKLKHLIPPMLLLISSVSMAAPDRKPERIVSMNLCTDQLLLLLADPENIASVSYLSLEEHSSFVAGQVKALGLPINHNLPEEVLPLNPDLIVTGQFLHQQETRLLKSLGQRVETFPVFKSLHDVNKNIMHMAELIGEQDRGKKLILDLNDRLATLLRDVPSERIPAVSYHARGYTQGKNTLLGELMHLAGWHNVATDFSIDGYGQISLEELVLAKPQKMIVSEYSPGTRSKGQEYLQHPVLKKLFHQQDPISIDTRLLICGGPMNLIALETLIKARNEF